MLVSMEFLVPPARIELATYGLGIRRSIQLSYGGPGSVWDARLAGNWAFLRPTGCFDTTGERVKSATSRGLKQANQADRIQSALILHVWDAPSGLLPILWPIPGVPFGHPRLAYKPAKHLTVAPSGG